jgi:Mitochondrial ribosomal protein (VAR1)
MINKTQKMALLFENHISKQRKIDKITNISNILNSNRKLNSNLISFQNLLEFNLMGLNIYNKNLSSYISKWNNKKLILNIKFDPLYNFNLKLSSDVNKKIIPDKAIENSKENINENPKGEEQISINNMQKINKYLKSITIFNSTPKSILFTFSQQISYKFKAKNKLIKKIYTFLLYSFLSMNSLISKPVFEITSEKVVIHLFFYLFKVNNNNKIKNTFLNINRIKLNIICQILSHLFKKPVELDLVRLYYPYFDSNIFVNLLAILINKIQVRIIMQKFFNKAIIKNPIKINRKILFTKLPSFLSGIKIRIAGRLLTHRIIPRQTVKTIRRGALARAKINFLDIAKYTNKNKRGAFSVTISTGHYLI